VAESRIIAIVGATGAQGGGLARAILRNGAGFAVRALTRDTTSIRARELADLGAEVIGADIDDPASLDRAFAGAYGAYCVTFYWEHLSPDREIAQARAMAAAARRARLQHLIWSTFEDTRTWVPLDDSRMPTLMGRYKVPHFDAKGEADSFFADLPVTFLRTSFYWDNLIYFGMGPKPREDGRLALAFPLGDKKLPGIAAEDIGKCAYGIFRRQRSLIGKTLGIAGEHLSGGQMAAALTRALGREVAYEDVDPDQYRHFGVPGIPEMGNMFQFKRDFEPHYCSVRDVRFSRHLNPDLQTFDIWLARNKHRIPIK